MRYLRYTPALILVVTAGVLFAQQQVPPENVEKARALEIENQSDHTLLQQVIERIGVRSAEIVTLLTPSDPGGGDGEVELHECHWPINKPHRDQEIDPVTNQACFFAHEHGDLPPDWLTQKGVTVVFGGDEATPNENVLKHQAYKGFSVEQDQLYGENCIAPRTGQEVYMRVHAASNPHDRSARFHSFEMYLNDCANNLTRLQGWYDTGTSSPYLGIQGQGTPHRRSSAWPDSGCGPDGTEGCRPLIGMVDDEGLAAGRGCEQWYMFGYLGFGFGPDFGWNICGATIKATANEHVTAHDQSVWLPLALGGFGTQRLFDLSFFKFNGFPRDPAAPMDVDFWVTQFGEFVSGPTDPLCGTSVSFDGKDYTRLCLVQHIASTYTNIGFSTGNTWQKIYQCRECRLPN
jgi:hypothetical protein